MSFEIFTISIISIVIIGLITFVTWYLLEKIHLLKIKIIDLEYDIKRCGRRFNSIEDLLIELSGIISEEQKESQRRSFVYGTTKLLNPEITKELVNEIAESNKNSNNSRKTLFDDLWKIEPPISKLK